VTWFAPSKEKKVRSVIRDLVAGAFKRAGFELIPTWRLEKLELANHLRELFARLEINCVLDIGANSGQYHDFLRGHLGYGGRIVSFEPVAELAHILKERADKETNWDVCRFALGSCDETRTINVAKATQFSSFLQPDFSKIDDYLELNQIEHQETVTVRTLDSVMDEIGPRIGNEHIYMKIDTQGFDLEVVRGAMRTLEKVLAMQTEVSVLKIYDGMPDFLTAIRVLTEKGFDITAMFPISRDKMLRVVEFDCVLLNRTRARALGDRQP
jgi:FkbM family methyltransferase